MWLEWIFEESISIYLGGRASFHCDPNPSRIIHRSLTYLPTVNVTLANDQFLSLLFPFKLGYFAFRDFESGKNLAPTIRQGNNSDWDTFSLKGIYTNTWRLQLRGLRLGVLDPLYWDQISLNHIAALLI
jgi:hypothetical protein